MKAARFTYARPRDLDEALDLLAGDNGATKVIAGGQSLGPMLNLRLLQPDLLVDIAAIPELRQVSRDGDTLVLGACVTHADIEDGRVPDATAGAMARVASAIAYRAVRHRGTIGGSLAHADPAADWVSALSCLGAEVELATRGGRRRLSLGAFLLGALTTALAPGELLASVRIPAVSASARFGYVKHCRKAGEFAHAIGAVLVDPVAGRGRAVIGALDRVPLVLDAASVLGGSVEGDYAARFDGEAADALLLEAGLVDDVARHVQVTVLGRAFSQAAAAPPPTLLREAA